MRSRRAAAPSSFVAGAARRQSCWTALGLAAIAAAFAAPAVAGDTPAAEFELPEVDVIATAPLPGVGLPPRQVPGNVQVLSAKQIQAQHALDTADVLNRNLGSVSINDTQNNPFQPDVSFRGFTASPVLGTPQGVSVFVDGVRVNEVFADTVNWDLIPESAIANLSLVPAANPAFGLGSMGGALSLNTKSGFAFPGTAVQAYGGSFGRRAAEFESGGHGRNIDYFVAGNAFKESGWAQHNSSKVMQFFGKTGYQDEHCDVDLSYTYADSRLEGNQTLPDSWLDDPSQSYTWPDFQDNRMQFVNLNASYEASSELMLNGNLHERLTNTGIANSNVSDDFDPTQPAGTGNEPANNVINHIRESQPGGSLQLNWLQPWGAHRNALTVGLDYEYGTTRFTQYIQDAGTSRDTSSNSPANLQVSLHTRSSDTGVYLTDNFAINRNTFLTASARYDSAGEDLEDRLGTALNGNHRFQRLNPAAGLTYNPTQQLTLYLSYGEGIRVPTPIELSCADPQAPCSLPNGFSGDPDLKPVISKSWEAGLRGRWDERTSWNAGLFRSRLEDDIQFISSGGGSNSAGYFRNVGRTRRQGAELGVDSRFGRWTLSAHYSLVRATFETPLLLSSPNNSTAMPITCSTCTDIRVEPGNRMPGIPRHSFKLRGEYTATSRFRLALDVLIQSDQFARGDENNRDVHGPVAGYTLLNADARYTLSRHWELFAKANNLLDSRYYTFALLSTNVFTGPGRSFDPTGASWRSEQFRSVGAPIGGWAGVRYRFGDGGAS